MKVNFNRIIIPSSRDDVLNILTKFIQCKICMNILNDPYDCLCCNQTFCKSCIINYIKTNNKCPFSEFFDFSKQKEHNQNKKTNINDLLNKIKPSSSNFTKIIQSLKFYCQNNDKGCNVELNIEEILEHQRMCKYKTKKIKVELKNRNMNNSAILKNNIKDKEKEKEIIIEKIHSFDSNNDLLQDNFSSRLKHQDSVVSFSGIKNLSENKDINQFNENENGTNNYLSNSKIEKSIEEINQKLAYINNFIINHYDYKSIEEDKFKSNKNIQKIKSDFLRNEQNDSQENKKSKRNSMTITNNYYEGAYINTLNNIPNNNLNNDCFNTINNIRDNKMLSFKTKISKVNIKEENKDKNLNIIYKSFKGKKNNIYHLLNEKEKNKKFNQIIKNKKNIKNKIEKYTELNIDKKNKEKLGSRSKDNILHKKLLTNNDLITNDTPKLGAKIQRHIIDIKPFELGLNLKLDNNNINNKGSSSSICCRTEGCSSNNLNEDIFNGIKHLNNKIIEIERLLQSNNSFKNQAYSIQNYDLFEDIQNDDSITKGSLSIKSSIKEIQNVKKNKPTTPHKESRSDHKNSNIDSNNKNESVKESNKDNNNNDIKQYSDEKIMKNFEELIIKIENNIKNILNEKFDSFKKYIEEQCMEDIKKTVLDTNFDIMTLCTDKLDEYEKVLNEKLNSLKF